MYSDTISDSLARVKNAVARRESIVSLRYSKIVAKISEILQSNGYIKDFNVKDEREIVLQLNYDKSDSEKLINSIKRVSTPGLRIYRGYKEMKPILNGYGIAIVSTSKGVMTDMDARKTKSGGEIICEIY